MNKGGSRKAAYDRAYNRRPAEKKRRAMRNAARREMMMRGEAHKGDHMDVDHERPLSRGGSNSRANLRLRSQKANRGWRRGRSGYKP